MKLLTSLVGTVVAAAVAAAATPPRLYALFDIDAGVGAISDVVFSADGRVVAAAGTGGYGVWDAQTGDPIRNGALTAPLTRVALGPQGVDLAVGGDDGGVWIVDLRSGVTREITRHRKPVTALGISQDGRTGASGDTDGTILLWDPRQGPVGPLKDGGHKKDIILLSFGRDGSLLSASKDLRVVTWDVSAQRPVRRATLQSEVSGRAVVPNAAAVDQEGTKLVLGSQLVSEPRGGFLTDRSGPARPSDLKRDNVIIPYAVATGMSASPVATGEFQPERIALSPSGCFAFFTSYAHEQPRLHVWGLLQQGDDLLRMDLQNHAVAVALEPAGRLVAVASQSGRLRGWRVSGATFADCDSYTQGAQKAGPAPGKPTVVAGAETDPLIQPSPGMKIAVLRFEATGVDPTLGDAVAEMVAGQLSNTKGIIVVERSAIDSVLREMEIQRSGLTTADAVRIGRGLNARKVLLGSVRKFGENAFMITARIVDVETQQVEGFREVQCQNCKEQDLPAAVETLRRIVVGAM